MPRIAASGLTSRLAVPAGSGLHEVLLAERRDATPSSVPMDLEILVRR